MALDSDTNHFLLNLYSGITDTGSWNATLSQFTDMIDAVGCDIFVVDHVAEELSDSFASDVIKRLLPIFLSKGYLQAEIEVVSGLDKLMLETGYIDVDQSCRQHISTSITPRESDLDKGRQWLADEFGIHNRFGSRLNIQPSYIDVNTLCFGEKSKLQLNKSVQLASSFLPHLAKVIELSRPFSLLKSRFRATLNVLDRFHLSVFILTSTGCVAVQNNSANRILDLSDAICIDGRGRLKSIQPENCNNLDASISRLITSQETNGSRKSDKTVLKRTSMATPYHVEISHLSDRESLDQKEGLLVIVIDPDHREIVDTSGMKEMFHLTNSEENVCQLLVDSMTTREIAESRNTSPETVKNQIKSILSKTNSRNRSDIIKRALTINIPVDRPD